MAKRRKPIAHDFRGTLKRRLLFVAALFLLYAGGLGARLFTLQILNHEELLARAERQYTATTKIRYGRGAIYDRNMNELTRNIEVESVYVTPTEVQDKRETARTLAEALNLDPERVYKKITRQRHFVWIKRKCSLMEVDRLRRRELPGVGFVPEQKRFYPKRELAASVLGFVGLDNQGLAGIEHYHHTLLKGATIRQVTEKDARGRDLLSLQRLKHSNRRSHDIVLTLDEVIQFSAEHHLKKQVEKFEARAGTAIVMDPHSGEIYALANVPPYNPNNYAAYPPKQWINRAVSNIYEPGSIFKPIVASAALDSGKARPNDIFYCENGSFRVGRIPIGEAANHKFGWLSLQNIIAKSSNIGAIKVARQVGEKPLHDYVRRFGFGSKLEIDLPGESAGKLRDLSHWSGLSLASISFGHEIGVTPIQMVTAMAAIANGGKLVKPRITRAVLKNGRRVRASRPEVVRPVLSEKTSRQMVEILKKVVQEGTGTQAALEGFEVAGKTGTAQIFDPEAQAYSRTDFLASFVGFVPADAPRLVILVMIEEPKKSYWGGTVAAPVFRNVSREVLRYLNIPSAQERVYLLDQA